MKAPACLHSRLLSLLFSTCCQTSLCTLLYLPHFSLHSHLLFTCHTPLHSPLAVVLTPLSSMRSYQVGQLAEEAGEGECWLAKKYMSNMFLLLVRPVRVAAAAAASLCSALCNVWGCQLKRRRIVKC